MKKNVMFPWIVLFSVNILLLFVFTQDVDALDITAASCSVADVQGAATSVQNSGGGTVFIPAGSCTWNSTVTVTGNVNFIGAGYDKTLLTLGSESQFFDHQQITNFARYSGIGFYAPDGRAAGTATAIYLREAINFRVDNCYFEGCWHGVISMKRVRKGLIDHNMFKRTDDYSSDYGISWGQETASKPALCEGLTGSAYEACENNWDAWWDDQTLHYGNYINENWIPGTENAIFVEDNVFEWKGSAIQSNWGTIQSLVVRYNTFTNRDGNNGGVKPGVIYYEIYNNTFTNLLPSRSGSALYLRGSGMAHHNTFVNYINAGQLGSYTGTDAYGYHYTEQVGMHDSYFYANQCVNCDYAGDSSVSWPKWNEGNPSAVIEGVSHWFRAPQLGDRIYPYTPYVYPHPLASGVIPVIKTPMVPLINPIAN